MAKSATIGDAMRTRKDLAFGLVLVAALVAVMLLLVATKPAGAAFPGSNGQIVFHSADSLAVGDPSTSDTEIFSMNSNGTGLAQLTVNAEQDFNPAWSPNGLEIAFEHRDASGDDEIFKMAANGTNQRRLTDNVVSDNGPAWSPSGKKIVFVSDRNSDPDIRDDIYVMNAVDNNNDGNGDNLKRLTRNPENDLAPAWSPNGKKIAFTSFRTNNYEIYTMKPVSEGKTNRPVNLSRNLSAHDSDPNWSPNGTKIAFLSRRGVSSDFEIYSMAANGTEQNPLTENTANDLNPAWSPDGAQIAFHSDRDGGNGEIYVMNANGSAQTRLTVTPSAPAHENNPDWQPGP
jgi:Tol biopolymer transport system component